MYEIFEKLRDEAGITNYRVAKDTGITESALSQWKHGKLKLKLERLMVLADYFNVPLDTFIKELR